jgi:hypothetical protein
MACGAVSPAVDGGSTGGGLATGGGASTGGGSGQTGGGTAQTGGGSAQDDGTPVRRACTNTFGSALSMVHGRLDGTLVSIVQPGAHGCNGDADHVHLQVQANGAVYDVAINVHDTLNPGNVALLARNGPSLFPAYSEGWHPNARLGYRLLPVSSTDFIPLSPTALAQALTQEFANVNHITVYGNGYGPTGMHDIHFVDGNQYDGAIITKPLSADSRQLFFRFANDVF